MKRSLGILIALVLLLSPRILWAHNLLAQATLHPDKIELEAFYDDRTPAKAALVKVLLDDKVVLEEKTDARGFCTLPRPEPGDYRILVNAGAGHRRTIELHVPALPTSAQPAQPSPVAESVRRADKTHYPWLEVLIGLGCIGLISLIYWAARTVLSRRATY